MANRNGAETVIPENKPPSARVLPLMLLTVISLFPCACNSPSELDSTDKHQETFDHVLTIPLVEYDMTLTKEELQQSADAIRQISSRTIGFAFEGRWGELIWCDPTSTAAGNALRIVRAEEGLEIVQLNSRSAPYTYATVDENGTYRAGEKSQLNLDLSRAPKVWSLEKSEEGFSALQKLSPVLSSESKDLKRPANALGWLFITRHSQFVCVSMDTKPSQDIIWVVQNGEGLDLIHSGPSNSGAYARVGSDGAIEFHEPFVGSLNRDWSGAVWKIENEAGLPAFTDHIHVLPDRLELPYQVTVRAGGRISVENRVSVH